MVNEHFNIKCSKLAHGLVDNNRVFLKKTNHIQGLWSSSITLSKLVRTCFIKDRHQEERFIIDAYFHIISVSCQDRCYRITSVFSCSLKPVIMTKITGPSHAYYITEKYFAWWGMHQG